MPMPQMFQQPAFAFVPTLIPVPQPVLPAYLTGEQAAAAVAAAWNAKAQQADIQEDISVTFVDNALMSVTTNSIFDS